jgi:hypothetical protein
MGMAIEDGGRRKSAGSTSFASELRMPSTNCVKRALTKSFRDGDDDFGFFVLSALGSMCTFGRPMISFRELRKISFWML